MRRHNREQRGLGKPETFNFLGFTFICGKSRQGSFLVKRKTRRDRMRAKLQEIKEELRRAHAPANPRSRGSGCKQVVTGYFNYHAVPTNSRALATFRHRRHRPLATHAAATQPEGPDSRGTRMHEAGRRLAPQAAYPSSLAQRSALPSNTRGGSRMRESRTYGSVRGAPSNGRPYRDQLSSFLDGQANPLIILLIPTVGVLYPMTISACHLQLDNATKGCTAIRRVDVSGGQT